MSIDDATPAEWDRLVMGGCNDVVEQPKHYNTGKVECIEAIEESMSPEEFKGYLKGNVLKYVWRYRYKGKPVEDLRKARWYLEALIKHEAGITT